MKLFIIFIRAVTPMGKNKVPMKLLKDLLEENGFKDVQTYIQSGNVILRTKLSAKSVEKKIHTLIKENFGGELDIFARTIEEVENVLKADPYKNQTGERHYYTFLSDHPDKATLKAFLELDFEPDKIVVRDQVIYTEYKTKGNVSKFNNNFYERKLSVRGTTRNYNTVVKVLALAKGI